IQQNQEEFEQYMAQYMQMAVQQNCMLDENYTPVSSEFYYPEIGTTTDIAMLDSDSAQKESEVNFQSDDYPNFTAYLDLIPSSDREQYPQFDMPQIDPDFLLLNSQNKANHDIVDNSNFGFRNIMPRSQVVNSTWVDPQRFPESKKFSDMNSQQLTCVSSTNSSLLEFSDYVTQPSQMIQDPPKSIHFLNQSTTNISNSTVNQGLECPDSLMQITSEIPKNDISLPHKKEQILLQTTNLTPPIDINIKKKSESEGDDQESGSANHTHKLAEQRRRNVLKAKFQELIFTLPPHYATKNGIEEGSEPVVGMKVRKAPLNRTHVLEFTNRYIQRMNGRLEELHDMEDALKVHVCELRSELQGLKSEKLD
ncbi:hypothetical protein HK096_010330, partial [Nowakowskiella sp. JEL0078]